MRVRFVLALAGIGLVGQLLSLPAAVAQEEGSIRPLPAVKISQSSFITRTYEGPDVAIDPADPNNIYVASADLQANTCHVFRSTDRGRNFRELGGPDFGSFTDCGLAKGGVLPQNLRMSLTFDPEGVLYWAVSVADPDPSFAGGRAVVLAVSRDEGETWTTTAIAEAPPAAGPDDAVTNFEPNVFIDPFGAIPRTVIVSWRRSSSFNTDDPTEGWARISTDGGKTFGSEVRPFEKNPGFDAPHLVMDAEGAIYWFQRERPPSPAEGEEPEPNKLVWAKSTDGGSSWEPGELGEADLVMEEPFAGVSPDGKNVYVVWADGRNDSDVDVFFKRTTDGGATWDPAIRVNDDPVGNRRAQKWPGFTVAPNGRIDVTWYDYRNDANDVPEDDVEFFLGDLNDVYYAFSEDGGETFSANLRVTDRPIDRTIGTYNTQYFVEVPLGIESSAGFTYFAWSDTRLGNPDNGAQDLFGTTVEFPAADAGGVGISGRGVLLALELFLIGAGLALLIGTVVIRARRRGAVSTS